MSIALAQSTNGAKSTQAFPLVIRVRNLSDQTVYLPRSGDPLVFLSFRIRAPSGRDLSPAPHEYTPGSQRAASRVKAKHLFSYPPIGLTLLWTLPKLEFIPSG